MKFAKILTFSRHQTIMVHTKDHANYNISHTKFTSIPGNDGSFTSDQFQEYIHSMHVQSLFQCNVLQMFSLDYVTLLPGKAEITRTFFRQGDKSSEPTCTFFHVVFDRIVKWGLTFFGNVTAESSPDFCTRIY
jgi:hypothetical protein